MGMVWEVVLDEISAKMSLIILSVSSFNKLKLWKVFSGIILKSKQESSIYHVIHRNLLRTWCEVRDTGKN